MERKDPGIINAYILNLMTHSDTLKLDEYELRDRIEKRFKQKKEHISGQSKQKKLHRLRPQNVRKFHLEPLVKRKWLRLLPDGRYERIGELKHVTPRETLFDQFNTDPEVAPYIDSYIYDKEFYRKPGVPETFEESLTEEEYNEYMDYLYKKNVE